MPLLDVDQNEAIKIATEAIGEFNNFYQENWYSGMRAKLGISNEEEADGPFIEDLLKIMQKQSADYTNNFRTLTLEKLEDMALFNNERI